MFPSREKEGPGQCDVCPAWRVWMEAHSCFAVWLCKVPWGANFIYFDLEWVWMCVQAHLPMCGSLKWLPHSPTEEGNSSKLAFNLKVITIPQQRTCRNKDRENTRVVEVICNWVSESDHQARIHFQLSAIPLRKQRTCLSHQALVLTREVFPCLQSKPPLWFTWYLMVHVFPNKK